MKKWLTLLLAGAVLAGCQNTAEEAPAEESQTEETSTQETTSTSEATSSQESSASAEASEASSEETAEASAQINISVEGEEVASQDVSFEEGTYLIDVMEENFDIELESSDLGAFVLSIEGYEQNESEGLYWMFDINGEMAPVGINEYELSDGDTVDWSLEGSQS